MTLASLITADYARILKVEGQSPWQVAVHVDRIRNLTVFRMPQILVRRYVVGKNRSYEGEKAEGYLRSIVKEKGLVILVRERMKTHNMAGLLRKEMAKCLGVTQHSDLLGDLLAADDPKSLLEDLQRAGAYRMDMADANNRQRIGVSGEIDSDSENSGGSSLDTALGKSTIVRTGRQQRVPATPEATHEGQPGTKDVQPRLNDTHYAESSGKSASSTGRAVRAERTSPTPRAATTTPPIRSAPNSLRRSLKTTRPGFADDSDDEFLASAVSKLSVVDDGPSSRISQHSPGFTRRPNQIEDASPATRTPRLIVSREEQSSPSPRQTSSGTRRCRSSGSFGRSLSPSAQVWGGPSRHPNRRSWDVFSSPSQPESSPDRKKEIGRKGEYIVRLRSTPF